MPRVNNSVPAGSRGRNSSPSVTPLQHVPQPVVDFGDRPLDRAIGVERAAVAGGRLVACRQAERLIFQRIEQVGQVDPRPAGRSRA